MKTHKSIKRGDIYYADLNPVVGSEQGGIRPVLIVQNNTGNKYSPTVIVAALTCRKEKADIPTHVKLPEIAGLEYRSSVLLEQIRTLDCSRLREYIGRLDCESMNAIDEALSISVGLSHRLNKSFEGVSV